MNLILVFSRKYRGSEHYFSVWCLGNSQNLLTTNQFLDSAIFFPNTKISTFNLGFDLFSIIAKKVSQIRNNVVNVADRLVLVFSCAPTTSCCSAFQHIFMNQKKSEFYSPHSHFVISCDYV